MDNKKLLPLAAVLAGAYLVSGKPITEKFNITGGGGGARTLSGEGVGLSTNESDPTAKKSLELPQVTIEGDTYVSSEPTNSTNQSSPKKVQSTSGSSSSGSSTRTPVSSLQDYNALPEGDTKKSFSTIYPTFSTPDGGTIQPTYGLGAGGTGIYTPPTYTPKKEAAPAKKSWRNIWGWL